jgi:short subunit dehydrogenase-like uncharacterized protein
MADTRALDVVLWGATGFTGQMATAYLAGNSAAFSSMAPGAVPASLRYGLAGRDRAKLERVKREMGCDAAVPIFVADADDSAAVDAIVRTTKVVVSLAGPFLLYGSSVVSACARFGTHYCDITGETHWVARMIELHEAEAIESGAVIVPLCGFDSIPSDIGCLTAVNALRRAEPGVAVKSVDCVQHFDSAGASGGSMANGPALAEWERQHGPFELDSGKPLDDVFLLGGEPAGGARALDAFPTDAVEIAPGVWGAPFMMGSINIRTVRRSQHLLDFGPTFCYQEYTVTKNEAHARKLAEAAKREGPPPEKIQVKEGGRNLTAPEHTERESIYISHPTRGFFWRQRVEKETQMHAAAAGLD